MVVVGGCTSKNKDFKLIFQGNDSEVSNNRTMKNSVHMAYKEGQFDVVYQFKSFSINLKAQHVNEMTQFESACTIVRCSGVFVLR